MFKVVLLALFLYVHYGPIMERPPDLVGLSTYYGPPAFVDGDRMADGTPLDLDAPTVAVDVSLRHLLGQDVLILTECGMHRGRITDTGRLYDAGLFRLGVRGDCLRYWPVSKPNEEWELAERVLERAVVPTKTHWLSGDELPVVLDFPMGFYAREVACEVDAWGKGNTQLIMVWILP